MIKSFGNNSKKICSRTRCTKSILIVREKGVRIEMSDQSRINQRFKEFADNRKETDRMIVERIGPVTRVFKYRNNRGNISNRMESKIR